MPNLYLERLQSARDSLAEEVKHLEYLIAEEVAKTAEAETKD